MATRMMVAKQTAQALDRIQATVNAMAQEVGIAPPLGLNKRYRDAEQARKDLIQRLADWLEVYHAAATQPIQGEAQADTPKAKGKK